MTGPPEHVLRALNPYLRHSNLIDYHHFLSLPTTIRYVLSAIR